MNQQILSNVKSGENESTLDKAKATAQEKSGPVREKVSEVADEAKLRIEQAGYEAKSVVAEQKEQAVSQLHGVAHALRQTGNQLRQQDQRTFASYSNQVADQIDRMSGYLQEREVDDLIRDAEDFARRQPELFIGGAFTLGLLAARFLKSSASDMPERRDYSTDRPRSMTVPATPVQHRTGETVVRRPYAPTD